MMTNYLLTIDQGTSSTRAIIFDHNARLISCAQQELTQYYPENGWVEHDGEEIWQTSKNCVEQALLQAKLDAAQIAAMGIANQRETTLLWHRDSGELLHRAIVWQDRRTAATCQSLIKQGYAEVIQQKTGLLIDPYFSATKLSWLLDHVPHARDLAEQGKLAFGTVDSFLLWRLSGGQVHATDATNAARTMLFNIVSQAWDDELLALFGIPASVLPEVCDSSGVIAYTDKPLFGGHSLPIAGVAGDQQAAAIGQACVKPGMIKSTYGTGCFALMNTGERLVQSQHRLLSTVAYRIDQQVSYALEGSIFVAGAAVQWLRDAMQLIKQAPDTETYAKQLDHNHGVYLVPAFTGLGAPYWDPLARGAIFGLTRETGLACIVRATLEAVCYQTRDLLDLMFNELGQRPNSLQVDGGMVANDWLMQFLSDMINLPVVRPKVHETSALGAAYLAGLGVGVYDNLDELAKLRQVERQFTPQLHESTRENLYKGWLDAVQRVRSL